MGGIKLLFLLFSYETKYKEVVNKIGIVTHHEPYQVQSEKCRTQLVEEAGLWVFPPSGPPPVEEDDNKVKELEDYHILQDYYEIEKNYLNN